MLKARFISLSLLAALTVFCTVAMSASAATKIRFEWKEGGGLLGAGESREFSASAGGTNFDLHGTVAGAGFLLLSHELSVEAGAKIIGGKPGTGEEKMIFKGVTVDNPTKCVVETDEANPKPGTVKTDPLKLEIVESEETGEPLILFIPKTGSVFAGLLLLDKSTTEVCTEKNALVDLTGTLLARPSPELTEVLEGEFNIEAPTKNFVLSSDVLDKAGLFLAGGAATLTGVQQTILTNDEKFGAF
jgi:hypothetical protein